MHKIPRHIVASLAALRFRDGQPEALRDLDESEWRQVLSFCDRMRLTLPFGQVCGDHIPDWVRSRIRQNLSDNRERFERIKAIYAEMADALRNAGVEHLVLKGFAQWPARKQDPRLRAQSDIDLYCPPESVSPALDAFSRLRYEPIKWAVHFPSDQHLPTMMRKTDWQWHGDFFDPEMPVSVDLHNRFWNATTAHFGPQELDQFWIRRTEGRLDDINFPALDTVDSLGYSTLHALRHLLAGSLATYHIYELACFLHTNAADEPFWKRWGEWHDDSLRSLEAISFRLAERWFNCRLPDAVEREISRLPAPVHRWLDEYGDSPIYGLFHPNKHALWLRLSLIQSSRDRRTVLREGLFGARMPPVAAFEAEAAAPDRAPSQRLFVQKHAEHFAYVSSRIAYHLRCLPATLWHGIRWWWSTKNLGKDFWTFYAASFCFDFGMFIYFFLYNLYLLDCGFTEKFVGWVTSAMSVGSMVGTVPAAMIAQRFGLRKTILFCFASVSIVFALRAFFVSAIPQIALAFIAGAVATIWAVCISPALAQLTTEQNRPFGFSIVFSFGIGEGVLGGLVGGNLPGLLARIAPAATVAHVKQMALLISCGIVALALWPSSRLKFVSSPPAPERKFCTRNPFLLRFLAAIAVWSLVTGLFSPFFTVYASQHLRMPLRQIGLVSSASQLSQVIAILLAPFIFRKFGLVTGIVYTQIATALALGCLAGASTASTAAVVYVGYMAFQWMSEPGMFSLLMNQVGPSERTAASALNFLVISLANAVAAAAAGASFVRFGYPAVLSVTAGVALVSAILFQVLLGNTARSVTSAIREPGLG